MTLVLTLAMAGTMIMYVRKFAILTTQTVKSQLLIRAIARYRQHFHYGYFLYAAAVVAKMDKGWLSETASGCDYPRSMFFQDLVRDIANPSTEDKAFPTFRYMDWFEGHSWVPGL